MTFTDRQTLAYIDALGEALMARQGARRGPKAIPPARYRTPRRAAASHAPARGDGCEMRKSGSRTAGAAP